MPTVSRARGADVDSGMAGTPAPGKWPAVFCTAWESFKRCPTGAAFRPWLLVSLLLLLLIQFGLWQQPTLLGHSHYSFWTKPTSSRETSQRMTSSERHREVINVESTTSPRNRSVTLTAASDRNVPTMAAATTRFISSSSTALLSSSQRERKLVVLFWTPFWGMSFEQFMRPKFLSSWPCSSYCELIYDRGRVQQADILVFHAFDYQPSSSPTYRSASQLWVFFNLEPPTFGFVTPRHDNVFNFTMTYRNDSDLPVGYGHFSAPSNKLRQPRPMAVKFEKLKPRAYWMASNCARNRMDFVRELSKHVQVDIFGKCSKNSRQCSKDADCELELSSSYAFYLAFENSLCPDYVTEKLWRTLASRGGAIPIVIGAPQSYYEALAPPQSFIHAENFTSLRELGEFMTKVASDRESFFYFHRWRARYQAHEGWDGELARGVCRLCESLHNGEISSSPAKRDLSHWANAGCRASWPHISYNLSNPGFSVT